MGWTYFDYKGVRHWMSSGNLRSAQTHEENGNETVLEAFLERNSVAKTKAEDYHEFRHPFEQVFPAQQRPGYDGVPMTDQELVKPEIVPMSEEDEKVLLATIPETPVNPALAKK